MTTANQVPDEAPDEAPCVRFLDRLRFLILTDDYLTTAECIGCLHMAAYEVATNAFSGE